MRLLPLICAFPNTARLFIVCYAATWRARLFVIAINSKFPLLSANKGFRLPSVQHFKFGEIAGFNSAVSRKVGPSPSTNVFSS